MEFLTSGSNAEIYQDGDHVVAILDKPDYGKHALSELSHPHLPETTMVNELRYTMPLYHPVSPENRPMVEFLISSWQNYANRNPVPLDGDSINFYNRVLGYIRWLEYYIDNELLDAIKIVVEQMAQYTKRFNLDFHDDNFMESETGNIILLDVVWAVPKV